MAVEKFVIESENTQLNLEENDPAIILVVFIISVLLGIVAYSIYVAFGPPASNLRDPFEEHEDWWINRPQGGIYYLVMILGGSRKNTEKNNTISVPISKNV